MQVKSSPCNRPRGPRGGEEVQLYSFFKLGARWGLVNATPRPLHPRVTDPVPLYRRLGGPPGRVWTAAENSPAPGFDPQTVQPVASRYTD